MADDGAPTNPTTAVELQNFRDKKLEIERSKIRWNAFSIIVPAILAILTLAGGFFSIREQSKLNFQLEAAKSIMQAPSVLDARGVREAEIPQGSLQQLPKGFLDQIPEIDKLAKNAANPPNTKIDFLKMLVSKVALTVDQKQELWITLFPNDGWAKDKQFVQKLREFTAQPTNKS